MAFRVLYCGGCLVICCRSWGFLLRRVYSELLQRLFRPERIDSMLQQHREGSANFTRELRALAALGLWDEGRALQ